MTARDRYQHGSSDRLLRGLIVSHRRDYATDNWRLRAFREKCDNHPIDPAWELGQYRECHAPMREKVCNSFNEYSHAIFDTVWDRRSKSMVIRSVFVISAVGPKRRLFYDRFWFCDGRPLKSPSPHMMRTKYGKTLDQSKTSKLLQKIRTSGEYHQYTAPAKRPPRSIRVADWNAMVRAGRKIRSC